MTRDEVTEKSQQIHARIHATEDLAEICDLVLELNRLCVGYNSQIIPIASVEELLDLDKAAAHEVEILGRTGDLFPAGYVKDFAEMWKGLRILIADEILRRNALARRR